jgi:hypothetical protein
VYYCFTNGSSFLITGFGPFDNKLKTSALYGFQFSFPPSGFNSQNIFQRSRVQTKGTCLQTEAFAAAATLRIEDIQVHPASWIQKENSKNRFA